VAAKIDAARYASCGPVMNLDFIAAAATFFDLCVPKTSDSDVVAMRSAKDRI
jgi:hypothetical protein